MATCGIYLETIKEIKENYDRIASSRMKIQNKGISPPPKKSKNFMQEYHLYVVTGILFASPDEDREGHAICSWLLLLKRLKNLNVCNERQC
jgi:hypothetical protein